MRVESIRSIALTQAQAAMAVGLSEREIRRAIAAGEIEVHYRGRRALVDVDDLRAWFKALPTERPH
ncbi:hypothetical protein DBB34_14520 [Sphaerisporangium cinnabarinum]|nr:helix-turn-helix domain-containing protein [Sphaerisporangium cinnabarinum]PTU55368.1 hypothetical protein DBB34_14520 [Sphaerisporangium cinnabarinum]